MVGRLVWSVVRSKMLQGRLVMRVFLVPLHSSSCAKSDHQDLSYEENYCPEPLEECMLSERE
jgi:hypothetical protein